jgi:hypothetical protein
MLQGMKRCLEKTRLFGCNAIGAMQLENSGMRGLPHKYANIEDHSM